MSKFTVLPLEKLMEIAHNVVDWENEGDVWVKGERYVVKGKELVREVVNDD